MVGCQFPYSFNPTQEVIMPKSKVLADSKTRKMVTKQVKFKLGNRKSTVSASSLSTDELRERFANGSNKRDRPNIAQVLHQRGERLVETRSLQDILIVDKNGDPQIA